MSETLLTAQVADAVEAVDNGGPAIGIRCKDGVVLAVEKLISSKLLKPGANKRIAPVDRNIGIVRSHLETPTLKQACLLY
jgi:20S proteasome subunit alpha 7